MKRFIVITILVSIITATVLALSYFVLGIEFLFLPLYLALFLVGLIGIVTIPLGVFKIYNKRPLKKWLIWTNAIACGFYLGYLFLQPIDNWDENERNRSGEIISTALENYKNVNGHYPERIALLDTSKLKTILPLNYKVDRFVYYVRNDQYDLYIPIPITDRWQWNTLERKWEYR